MKRCLVLIAIVCLSATTIVQAQTGNATLSGTVEDSSGALIPGVTIAVTNVGTGILANGVTNEAGAYTFPSLQPGTYKISAVLPGFQTQTYNDVMLGVSQQLRLNFTLQIASVAQSIEVTTIADTLISTSSSSVGTVLPEARLRDLPLVDRNVLELVSITAGTGPSEGLVDGNFAGGRISAVNVTRDGFVVSNGRYDQGTFAATYVSPDLVEEVRVITATVDAEAGRGSGQVQMSTRSGTNQYRGSIFWTNHNSKLDAANWFNNFNRVDKNWENRNQFGGRLGGPIIKNKTFFFVLVEEQRDVTKESVVGTVLTPQARNGLYRYFPGADNRNFAQSNPTVDRNGNPVQPASATGPLVETSLFGRDPLRPGFDPSGFVQNTLLANMPIPNDFSVGDGLNTAGIRWVRRVSGSDVADGNSVDQNNRDQVNLRLDHNFNSNNKLSFVHTWERGLNHTGQAGLPAWPNGYQGENNKWPRLYTGSLVSTISSSMVNELRIGLRRTAISSWAPFYVGREGRSEGLPAERAMDALNLLPTKGNVVYQPVPLILGTTLINWGAGFGSTRGSESPLWTFSDSFSWSTGRHSFKFGGEHRRDRSLGWNDNNFTPQVIIGGGNFAAAVINSANLPGLTATNQTLARNLLYELSGSVASIRQGMDVRDPDNPVFLGYADGVKLKIRDWRANEMSAFAKDDWKISNSLTLNLGVHWEYFAVPYEKSGIAGAPVGGADALLCGYDCGVINVQFVGKNSPDPSIKLRENDWNNFAPSVGFSWSLPWFGADRTVLRAGYGISYTGGELKAVPTYLDSIAGAIPGAFHGTGGNGQTYTSTTYTNLNTLTLPLPPAFSPLRPVPLLGNRSESIQAFSSGREAPYIQNFNVEVQRTLRNDLTLSVSYVGTKGTRLFGGIPVNVVDINAAGPNGETILQAFNTTRTGGNSPLFDLMLNGLNIGSGASTVNGTTVHGSDALRANSTTQAQLANGNVGALANFLYTSTVGTGSGGGLLRQSGAFPEDWIVPNPQFSNVTVHSNPSSSTYHSMQVQVTKRLSYGFTNQTSYTWSRGLGNSDGDGTINSRDPKNRALDKALLGFHRTHNLTSNGTWELPFGPNRRFVNSGSGWVQRLVESWQMGAIFSVSSGAPLTVTAPVSTIWQNTANSTPMQVGEFPNSIGEVTKVQNGVVYFGDLQQVRDPAIAGLATNVRGSFTNFAIADANGNFILVNPGPGQIGSLGRNVIEGPGRWNLDMNLMKRVRIDESRNLEFRLDSSNILNHANFGNPNVNINSSGNFGRITSASDGRTFTLSARLNF